MKFTILRNFLFLNFYMFIYFSLLNFALNSTWRRLTNNVLRAEIYKNLCIMKNRDFWCLRKTLKILKTLKIGTAGDTSSQSPHCCATMQIFNRTQEKFVEIYAFHFILLNIVFDFLKSTDFIFIYSAFTYCLNKSKRIIHKFIVSKNNAFGFYNKIKVNLLIIRSNAEIVANSALASKRRNKFLLNRILLSEFCSLELWWHICSCICTPLLALNSIALTYMWTIKQISICISQRQDCISTN